jgi:hypothetical protein
MERSITKWTVQSARKSSGNEIRMQPVYSSPRDRSSRHSSLRWIPSTIDTFSITGNEMVENVEIM